MCIENLEGGPFARSVWALHRPTKATALAAYWNTGLLTVLQIQFEKLKPFQSYFTELSRCCSPVITLVCFQKLNRFLSDVILTAIAG